MPEIRFQIQWPDGSEETCYSPSLVVRKYFEAGTTYPLDDFVSRAREALQIGSDRVQAAYGMPCCLALGQLRSIETRAAQFQQRDQPAVKLLRFVE